MRICNNKTKRGQTLIEVMVSLTLITIVFAGTMTLIVNIYRLTLTARNKTIVTSLAQSALAKARTQIQGSCSLTNYPIDVAIPLTGVTVPAEISTLTVVPKLLDTDEIDTGLKLDDTNFIKLTATVTWEDKGIGTQNYIVSEIIRR